MESGKKNKIPVVNFSQEKLKPGSDSWVLASKQVRYGLEEYGCFEIVFDEFPLPLHSSIFDAAKDLFDLPIETKMNKTSPMAGAICYATSHPTAPLSESTVYETIRIDNPTTLEGAEYFTNIMWPQGNDIVGETVYSFSKRLAELYETTTKMVFENYGVKKLFDSFKESTFYFLRFFKYRACQLTDKTNAGLGAHTDSGFISIVHQHQVEGLQVKTKDGKWIDVEPSSSSFLVLAGDLLMAWSNDRIRACEHRVVMKQDKDRYSLVLFTFLKELIQVPEELIDDKYPLRYKPIDSFGYNLFFVSEESRKFSCRIKAFCGI